MRTNTLREALAHIRHEVETRKLTGSVTLDFKRGEASPRVLWKLVTGPGDTLPLCTVATILEPDSVEAET